MDFFNNKLVAQLNSIITELTTDLSNKQKECVDLTEELDRLKADIELNKRDDTIPWFEITSDGYDEVKGVKISMDWNDAFIKHLEELSIKGPTEDAAVQRWLALVNLNIIDQLESSAIDNDPRGTVPAIMDGF